MENIALIVREAIAKQLEEDVSVVLVTSSIPGLGLDSLDVVQISMSLEEQFGIKVPTKDLEAWESGKVADIVLYIDKKVKEKV